MSSHERLSGSESGFSLMAVMIAVVLVSVAVVALSGTTIYVMSMQTESTVRSTAAGLAAAYMEEVKARPVQALESEAEVAVTSTGRVPESALEQADYRRELIVEPGPAPRSKLVTVVVEYPRGRLRMGRVELVTILYEGVGSS
ncbi:MAG: hypothetical protein GWN99_14980 [Gemmatimonadetes bacterium]|uniref:Type II secretion system protein n=1 Tax=Candidatus Kutchimonas denitrificans TaxID=3056748 RepID=A0AAE4Z9Z7_9BACT|nr:hypothetical protein [Gemmatimonadota bacterium]NIR76328.1 hypothetical protein [Candidatus Kutchimonas denitrificans]NIS02351.1 hypothetical protein [Gemmatimonadota bacterium]NIT68170.1 hypothetical protein [Gemmatimonadota bacterium]NIU54394.1 hypothetical protein [Gemmatimonadota bacterium]